MNRAGLIVLLGIVLLNTAWGQAAPPAVEEVRGDYVVAVVGDQIVTRAELDAAMTREAERGRRVAPQAVLSQRVLQLLKTQAGKTLGYDPELVRLQLKQRFATEVERQGGTVETSHFLERIGMTPDDLREFWRDDLYALSWENTITGKAPGTSGRVSVDRYIRPGQKYSYYEIIRQTDTPTERAKLGAEPPRVVLQEMILPVERYGGDEGALELATSLREAALKGEDFGELVRLHSADATNEGIGSAIPLELIRQIRARGNEEGELSSFLDQAVVGDISPPLLGADAESGRKAVFLYLVHERLPGEPPLPFLDIELQKELDRQIVDILDRMRLSIAVDRVAGASYIWPTELRQRAEESGRPR